MSDWDVEQDSLRQIVLNSRENQALKNSLLQELYICNIITVQNDSAILNIGFDVHGPDCGAPDCYSTSVHLSFLIKDSLVFPKYLDFIEEEYGCVEVETKFAGIFELIEQSSEHVIYHSTEGKRTLVLSLLNFEYGSPAMYIVTAEKSQMTKTKIQNFFRDFNEEDEEMYPYMSTQLTRVEYGWLIK